MDRIDRHILELLQRDARQSTADLAEKVGLSASPCARRVKRLEEEGIIDGYHANLCKTKVGVGMVVFVEVSLSNHQVDSIDVFEGAITEMSQVISCHVVSGAYDYLLEVVSKDLEGYESFIRQLQCMDTVKDIHTHLSIRQVKKTRELPVFN
ncbi:Lrp/AsnC family transcriptional regulator [Vibrio sp. TRT 21S02]|uniref:Lrp/AsnC family transcriptional regulator n=1 Tax=unclassified Vibrio TaxID=2614977 RepID=UPI00349FAACD